jgi:hypothetical protein
MGTKQIFKQPSTPELQYETVKGALFMKPCIVLTQFQHYQGNSRILKSDTDLCHTSISTEPTIL